MNSTGVLRHDDVGTASNSDDFQAGCSVEMLFLPPLHIRRNVLSEGGSAVGTAQLRQQ